MFIYLSSLAALEMHSACSGMYSDFCSNGIRDSGTSLAVVGNLEPGLTVIQLDQSPLYHPA